MSSKRRRAHQKKGDSMIASGSRRAALVGLATFIFAPVAALADRQADKRSFIAQCDESISIDRLAGAPFKFVGKKVDLHGTVGAAMSQTDAFNLVGESGFVGVFADARNLEEGQTVRVLGVVQQPQNMQLQGGGSKETAVVKAYFMS